MRAVKIALAVAVPVVAAAAAIYFAHEANYFPQPTRRVRSFEDVSKIWSTGGYLCAKDRGRFRCASLGLGADGVENAVDVPFLDDPVALVGRMSHVCALEGGVVSCWDMTSHLFRGLGLVYSPSQERAGTIDHGEVQRHAAVRLPGAGEVRSLVGFRSLICTEADDGITCFRYAGAEEPLPGRVFHAEGRGLRLSAEHDLLCMEQGEAIVCFGETDGSLEPRLRLRPAAGVRAVASSWSMVCALGQGSVACAPRASGESKGVQELRLAPVQGLTSPTVLWATSFDFFALDGGRIVTWSDRQTPSPKTWAELSGDGGVYAGGGDWFFFRDGTLLRSPNQHWPRRYVLPGRPLQLVEVASDTCALVRGRVICFDY
ncbi:MAG: hypothetical protein JXR96_16190 [Deltaproteobacteria bacterium]|nr:hypothetical protein [Deltaproteobacteria bacterium]